MFIRLILLGAFGSLFAGCRSEPAVHAWNSPPKSELFRDWLRVGNPEVDLHRHESPYP